MRNVWSQAAREIAGAKYIFIIGYSMPPSDLFFQHLLALGTLNITRIKSFWVVDTNNRIIARYKKLIRMASEETFRQLGQAFDHFAVEHIHDYLKSKGLVEA